MMNAIRILHVVTYMGRGGLETMLMNYYRHIDRSKVQFDFLVHRDFEADYDKEIKELGGRIYHVSRLIPWSKKYKKELTKFFHSHPEYSIVHVHQDCLSSVALKCAEECNIPVRIAHCHSSSAVKNIKYPIKLFYMKKIPEYATHLFACGKEAGDWMFSGNPYEVVRNAINLDRYSFTENVRLKVRENLGITNTTVVGHVGNFTAAKNHSFLIDIFEKIHAMQSNTVLLLVGGGDGMEDIKKKVEKLQLSDCVRFLGTRTDVNELMQAMDVFVFPSLYEGLPVTMIEEQASGIPAVISDHVSDECIVTNDLISVMKLEDSPEAWAEMILKQSKKARVEHYSEIQAAGYDINIEAKKLEQFYLTHS